MSKVSYLGELFLYSIIIKILIGFLLLTFLGSELHYIKKHFYSLKISTRNI